MAPRPRRRHVAPLVCLAALAACRDRQPRAAPASGGGASAVAAAKLDLAAWLRMRPSEFGCWMERSFGHRDAAWNCTAPERPPVNDPCDDGFEDGPAVPPEVARRIHPLLRQVEVAWEHGSLQSARFHFDPGLSKADEERVLGVTRAVDSAAAAGPGTCDTPCYELVVFEPAEADCDDDAEEDGE